MKQKYRNILILFMAATIFFVGGGVTIIDLCCSYCIENVLSMDKLASCGIAEIEAKDHSCCSSQNTSMSNTSPCSNQHEGECCEVQRIEIDLNNRVHQPDMNSIALWASVHCFCCCFCHTTGIAEDLSLPKYSGTVPMPPREYLSLIRVLII